MIRLIVAFALLSCAWPAHAANMSDLLTLFTGTFDSKPQWDMETGAKIKERHPWTGIVHVAIQYPDLGPHVFYVQERDAQANKIVRQRFVTFSDEGGGVVRMKQYALRMSAHWLPQAPTKTGAITLGDLGMMQGCDVLWHIDSDGHWAGEIKDKACAVPGQGRARYAQYKVTLTPLMYLRVDRTLYTDTDALADGIADERPTVHMRQK